MKRTIVLTVMALIIAFGATGCRKPVRIDPIKEIKNNETGFVVPLEGANKSGQAKFGSVEYLEEAKVATKRIVIPQRYRKTGRYWFQGEWIPTMKVITVDRTPVTRQWTPDENTGTTQNNESIQVESQDSVGFSVGFGCTAMVEEANTATFLYYYPSGSLARVMDSEIRERIQRVAAIECAKDDLDQLRAKKNQVQKAVETDVIEFYAKVGVTIRTVSMFGGFLYENEKIQTAIDGVFIAQQEKTVAKAMLDAQKDKNLRLEQEGEGLAKKAIKVAEGEAQALRLVNDAAKEANENPFFLELKKLEVEMKRLEVWDGKYPQWYMGGAGEAPNVLVTPPAVQ